MKVKPSKRAEVLLPAGIVVLVGWMLVETLRKLPYTVEGVPDAVVSLGRDDKLEQAILADIQAGISTGTGAR